MPLIAASTYRPPGWLPGGHLQTVLPNALRRVTGVRYRRERIDTPDGDFIDLDWSGAPSGRLAVVCHGLEGSSQRPYMLGMARALTARGWEVLAWNYRGCSGEPNRRPGLYHSGATGDLAAVVDHALESRPGADVALVGFSLGGNLVLKYLGESGDGVPERVRAGVGFSVPCDLADSAAVLARPANRPYMRRFLRQLRAKIAAQARQFPERVSLEGYERIRDFRGFDDRYTAPLHGFADAEDYWRRCSCRPLLPLVRRPVLVVSALNDPLLGERCYPVAEAAASPWLHLETPAGGGHVGFWCRGDEPWSERRAAGFLEGTMPGAVSARR